MSSPPAKIRIVRVRGDSWPFQLRVRVAGALQSLAGYTVRFTVDEREDPDDASTQVFQLTGTEVSTGLVEFAPTAEQADVEPGTYYCDVEIDDSTPHGKKTIAMGEVVFIQDKTK